ncbi:MAG: TonB-dependent receptor plug domain-containing protein, partial [Verrucomicrobiota bacterium]|nr:TonB-dependent receptor plug domain-containing protein [Verrucomicrobiota bacterium]
MPQKNPKFAFTLLLAALLSLCGIITPLNGDDNASLRGELLGRFQQKLSASEEVTETLVVAAPEGTAEEKAAETEVFTPTEEVTTKIVLTLPEEIVDEKEEIGVATSELSEVTATSKSSLSSDGDDEMVYLLDDFIVSAEDDKGYYSANTLAGTRTNELTKNIPMTISTVNQEMIEDFGLQTLADLGNYVPSIESEGNAYNNSAIRFRGFVARNALFEFMPRYSPLDYYMVERADVIRGANSLIYGQADPGGKINTISKMANLSKNETRYNVEFGDHSHRKYQLDTNVLLNDSAAVRVMAVDSYREFTQDHRFQKFQGIALESTYTPTQNTRLRFHVDIGQADRSLIASTFTMQGGPTGLPRGIVADPKLADLVEDDFLDYLVNYN